MTRSQSKKRRERLFEGEKEGGRERSPEKVSEVFRRLLQRHTTNVLTVYKVITNITDFINSFIWVL